MGRAKLEQTNSAAQRRSIVSSRLGDDDAAAAAAPPAAAADDDGDGQQEISLARGLRAIKPPLLSVTCNFQRLATLQLYE